MVIMGGPNMEEKNYLLIDWSKSILSRDVGKNIPTQKYMCGMFYSNYKDYVERLREEDLDMEAMFLWNNDFGIIHTPNSDYAEVVFQPYGTPVALRGYLLPITVGLGDDSKLIGYVLIQEHDDFVPVNEVSVAKRIGGFITSFFKRDK